MSQQNPDAYRIHEADVVFNLVLIHSAIAQQPAINLSSLLVNDLTYCVFAIAAMLISRYHA
jgi:hypothetical protein